MPNYHEFMMRHGEHGVQALVENMERYRDLRSNACYSLEQRWNMLMQDETEMRRVAA